MADIGSPPPFYVDLPETITERMWDVIRAVAAGHGDSGMLQAECIHLVQDIDRLLQPVVESEVEQIEEGK